jgi:transposase-like protein
MNSTGQTSELNKVSDLDIQNNSENVEQKVIPKYKQPTQMIALYDCKHCLRTFQVVIKSTFDLITRGCPECGKDKIRETFPGI